MLLAWDAALRRRSVVAWCAFRIVCGGLVALGLFAWLAVWFKRNPWAALAMAVGCATNLASELGILSNRPGDPGPGGDGTGDS